MLLPNLKSKRVFILGGGPNLDTIDLNLLRKEITIGVNMSYRHNPTINFANDRRFWQVVRRRKDWIEYRGFKVFSAHNNCPKADDIISYPVTDKVVVPNVGGPIYPGNNSGFGAIQLAIALGSKELYLLGYDMQVNGNKIHWHEEYPGQNNTLAFRRKKLNSFKEQIEDFARLWFSAGIDIQICTPSALTCFEQTSIEKVLG